MFDPERLLGSLLSAGLAGGLGGARGQRRLKKQVKRAAFSPQALMLLAGVGMAAWEHLRQKHGADSGASAGQAVPPMPPPMPPPTHPRAGASGPDRPVVAALPGHTDQQLRTIIAAMVAAAKADGTISDEERARMLARFDEAGAGEQERALLEAELASPLDVEGLVARVSGPVLAAEVYAASVAAIDADTPAEHGYLAFLAGRLGLDADLVAEIHRRVAAVRETGDATPDPNGATT